VSTERCILFWFYKEIEICKNRLDILKRYNPNTRIFGLFGGDIDEFKLYKKEIGYYFDDLYCFVKTTDQNWKWIHGDLVLLDWYDNRGKNLDWNQIAVVQWDTLVLDNINSLFINVRSDEILLSGYRILDNNLEQIWNWTRNDRKHRKNYLRFLEYIKTTYKYRGQPYCCLFIFQIFNKIFFEKYLQVKNKELGMLEYKIPIYSNIFNIPVHECNLGVKWHDNNNKAMNAIPKEIPEEYICIELAKNSGYRIFHPYFKIWKHQTP